MSFPIVHIDNQQGHGFCMAHNGNLVAEMAYSRVSDKRAIMAPTRVEGSLTGQGAARSMLDALVVGSRARAIQALATCPYAIVQFHKGPSMAGVCG